MPEDPTDQPRGETVSSAKNETAAVRERYRKKVAQLERENRRLADSLEQATARVEELEARPDASEVQAELEGVYAVIREGAYFAAFEDAAKEAGVDPRYVEDLWKVATPEIADKDPDPKAMLAHVAKALEGRPAMRAVQPTDDDEEEGEEGEDVDGEAEDAPSSSSSQAKPKPPTALDLARPRKDAAVKPRSKAKAEEGEDEGGSPNAPKPSANGKLAKGEGASRGARDKPAGSGTIYDTIDADFAATGRDDAFKL